jgi:hypothetical protein
LCLFLNLSGIDSSTRASTASALMTGVAGGFAALVRATGLALAPLWLFIRIFLNNNIKSAIYWFVCASAAVVLVVLPWTARNYYHFGKVILVSTNGGQNFWIGNNPRATGGYFFPKDDSNPLLSLIGTETVIDQRGYELGRQFILENPTQAVKLIPAKIFYLYNSNDFGLHWNKLSAVNSTQPGTGPLAFALVNLVYVVVVLFALIGVLYILIGWRVSPRIHYIGIIFAAYWTLIQIPYFGQDRFALPILPTVTIYAAVGICAIVHPKSSDSLSI